MASLSKYTEKDFNATAYAFVWLRNSESRSGAVEDLEIRFNERETYLQGSPNKWQAAENFQALMETPQTVRHWITFLFKLITLVPTVCVLFHKHKSKYS